jgi:hypothetical protein
MIFAPGVLPCDYFLSLLFLPALSYPSRSLARFAALHYKPYTRL